MVRRGAGLRGRRGYHTPPDAESAIDWMVQACRHVVYTRWQLVLQQAAGALGADWVECLMKRAVLSACRGVAVGNLQSGIEATHVITLNVMAAWFPLSP